MADRGPINAGEHVSNAPAGLPLSPDAQFRTLSARIDELTQQVSNMPKPSAFRLADGIQLATIVVGIFIAIFTAFGLNTRVDNARTDQAAAETRLTTQITNAESRVTTRLDKLNDQFIRLNERNATVEGRQQK